MYSRQIVRSIMNFKINVIIKILILSDFLLFAASQLMAPIFAIFITDKIIGAGLTEIGIASALFLISKSIFEMPVGIMIDKTKSEKDDLYSAILGTILTGIVFILYIYVNQIWQLYTLQILLGIAGAIAYPGWCSIFTKHVDKGKEAFEWSLYDVMLGVGMAGAAALGGLAAELFGFNILFIVIAILTFLAGIMLFFIKDKIFLK